MWSEQSLFFLLLVPILISGHNEYEERILTLNSKDTPRFGFGALPMVQEVLKTICKERCSNTMHSGFQVVKQLLCALKCPDALNPSDSVSGITGTTVTMTPAAVVGTSTIPSMKPTLTEPPKIEESAGDQVQNGESGNKENDGSKKTEVKESEEKGDESNKETKASTPKETQNEKTPETTTSASVINQQDTTKEPSTTTQETDVKGE